MGRLWLAIVVVISGLAATYDYLPACSMGINSSAPWADCILDVKQQYGPLPDTSVTFTTTDNLTQALFAHAEACEAANTQEMASGFDVLVEGGHYNAVWLETQVMT